MTDEEMTYFYADIETGCGAPIDVENEKLKKEVQSLRNKVLYKEFEIIGVMHFIEKFISENECIGLDNVQKSDFVREKILRIMENQELEILQLRESITKIESITDKVFEEIISKWHDSDVDLRVFEYMGISEKEYAWWLERSCKK